MNELKVQEFLRSGKSIQNLKDLYKINSKRHSKYNNLVLLKYTNTESPFSEEIVRECRGIILDEENNWNAVARAFDKFFNYDKGYAGQESFQYQTTSTKN